MIRAGTLSLLALAAALLFAVPAGAAVLASLDHTTVAAGDSVQLTLSSDGGDGDPDFTPLERDFDILARSQSSQFRFVNGRVTSSKSWQLTLMPKHSGKLTIPPIAVGGARSNALTLTVLPPGSSPSAPNGRGGTGGGAAAAQQDRPLFVEAAVQPRQVRVQQQLLYTVRIFRAVNLSQAQLSEPDVPHAVVVRLGEDRSYQTVRGGRRYLVTERRYAIFPQQRGKLTVPPLRLDGRIGVGGMSLFDPFNSLGQVVRRFSNPVTVTVEGIPATWPGGAWLPARAVTLEQHLSDGPYRVGEPITRSVTLHADGLTAAQLPQLLGDPLPGGLKRYPDQPQTSDAKGADGVRGTRRDKEAIIPLHGGDFTLPAIDIAWWNSDAQRVEHARLPERTIHVVGTPAAVGGGAGTTAAAGASPSTAVTPAGHAQQQQGEQPAKAQAAAGSVGHPRGANGAAGRLRRWQAAALLFALAWLGTLGLWWRTRRRLVEGSAGEAPEVVAPADGEAVLRRRIERALDRGDAASLVADLAAWRRWWRARGVDPSERVPELTREIEALHRHRYGAEGEDGSWRADGLRAAFAAACAALDGMKKGGDAPLPPLYRDDPAVVNSLD